MLLVFRIALYLKDLLLLVQFIFSHAVYCFSLKCMIAMPLVLVKFHCSKMPILWASCSIGFLRRPVWRCLLFKMYTIDLIELSSIVAVIASLMITLCIGVRHVLLFKSIPKKSTIFLSMGVLEHSPLPS